MNTLMGWRHFKATRSVAPTIVVDVRVTLAPTAQSSGSAHGSAKPFEWTRSNTLYFIELLKQHPSIWMSCVVMQFSLDASVLFSTPLLHHMAAT